MITNEGYQVTFSPADQSPAVKRLIKEISLQVTFLSVVKPTIHSGSEQITLQEGASLLLPCNCTGEPAPTLTWLDPSGASLLPTLPSGAVSMPVTSAADTGIYTCRCTNAAGSVTHSIYVSIQCRLLHRSPV